MSEYDRDKIAALESETAALKKNPISHLESKVKQLEKKLTSDKDFIRYLEKEGTGSVLLQQKMREANELEEQLAAKRKLLEGLKKTPKR